MEKKYVKSEIIDSMKEVIAPVVQRLDRIEEEQRRMKGDINNMKGDINSMKGDINSMKGDIQIIKKDLAQKPDRDEVKTIIRDELKNNPSVYIFDRDGHRKLMTEWFKEDVEKQVKDILRKEKVIA